MSTGIIPVFHHPDLDVAKGALEACERAGCLAVEFTHRADFAQEVFAALSKDLKARKSALVLGVGSVVEEGTAAQYINIGADFVVSPLLNPEIARICNRRKVAYCPGCGSVSEIGKAEELGVEICKIFPGAEVGGPEFIKAVLGPMPWSRLMPTGGVENTRESISAWLQAGACCLGMGSKLISSDLLKNRDFDQIEKNVRQAVGFARAARA